LRILISELMGTFFLVLMGCGSIVVNDLSGGLIGHLGVSMSFGLIVMVMIYSIGNISGAHMNPAVSLAFFISKRMDLLSFVKYLSGQFAGSLLAAFALSGLFSDHENFGMTVPSVPPLQAFIVEIILTMLLMFVIFNISTGHMEKGIMAGVAVGGVIALEALVGGPLTGASMNPFRSLAPALVSGKLSGIWIYLSAPFLGAILAWPAYYFTGKAYCSCNCSNEE